MTKPTIISDIKVSIDGCSYTARPALITSTRLGTEDHGIMTFNLDLALTSSTHQGFGSVFLDEPGEVQFSRIGTAVGMTMIMRVLGVVGVEKWEDLRNHQVMALYDDPFQWGDIIKGLASFDLSRSVVSRSVWSEFGL